MVIKNRKNLLLLALSSFLVFCSSAFAQEIEDPYIDILAEEIAAYEDVMNQTTETEQETTPYRFPYEDYDPAVRIVNNVLEQHELIMRQREEDARRQREQDRIEAMKKAYEEKIKLHLKQAEAACILSASNRNVQCKAEVYNMKLACYRASPIFSSGCMNAVYINCDNVYDYQVTQCKSMYTFNSNSTNFN